MQPFESIMPIINNPAINTNKPLTLELLAKVCLLGPMAQHCYCCIGPHNIPIDTSSGSIGVDHVSQLCPMLHPVKASSHGQLATATL